MATPRRVPLAVQRIARAAPLRWMGRFSARNAIIPDMVVARRNVAHPSRPGTGDTAETAAFSCTCHPGGGKARLPCAELHQFVPRGGDLVAQDVDEPRWRSNFRALAIAPLPSPVGQFSLNRGAVLPRMRLASSP
jgi:hypothetical protein